MSREVVARLWCDACHIEGRNTETETTVVLRLGDSSAEVELCDEHHHQLRDELLPLLLNGRPISEQRRAISEHRQRHSRADGRRTLSPSEETITCPVCQLAISSRGSAIDHIYRAHLSHLPRPAAPRTCPECGKEFDNSRAAGMHRWATHGTSQWDDVLAALREEGYAGVASETEGRRR